ncbi:hypothetical protein KEM48_005366 [Puccinia striiformis f. sp. tritici PST-130]|nr:hypothetical protein KEM48_005366 [Puccinia striiformis f. sp. tritici PST-130]
MPSDHCAQPKSEGNTPPYPTQTANNQETIGRHWIMVQGSPRFPFMCYALVILCANVSITPLGLCSESELTTADYLLSGSPKRSLREANLPSSSWGRKRPKFRSEQSILQQNPNDSQQKEGPSATPATLNLVVTNQGILFEYDRLSCLSSYRLTSTVISIKRSSRGNLSKPGHSRYQKGWSYQANLRPSIYHYRKPPTRASYPATQITEGPHAPPPTPPESPESTESYQAVLRQSIYHYRTPKPTNLATQITGGTHAPPPTPLDHPTTLLEFVESRHSGSQRELDSSTESYRVVLRPSIYHYREPQATDATTQKTGGQNAASLIFPPESSKPLGNIAATGHPSSREILPDLNVPLDPSGEPPIDQVSSVQTMSSFGSEESHSPARKDEHGVPDTEPIARSDGTRQEPRPVQDPMESGAQQKSRVGRQAKIINFQNMVPAKGFFPDHLDLSFALFQTPEENDESVAWIRTSQGYRITVSTLIKTLRPLTRWILYAHMQLLKYYNFEQDEQRIQCTDLFTWLIAEVFEHTNCPPVLGRFPGTTDDYDLKYRPIQHMMIKYLNHDSYMDHTYAVSLAVIGIWYKTFHLQFWNRHFKSDQGYWKFIEDLIKKSPPAQSNIDRWEHLRPDSENVARIPRRGSQA